MHVRIMHLVFSYSQCLFRQDVFLADLYNMTLLLEPHFIGDKTSDCARHRINHPKNKPLSRKHPSSAPALKGGMGIRIKSFGFDYTCFSIIRNVFDTKTTSQYMVHIIWTKFISLEKLGSLFVQILWVRGSVNLAGIDFLVSPQGSIYQFQLIFRVDPDFAALLMQLILLLKMVN